MAETKTVWADGERVRVYTCCGRLWRPRPHVCLAYLITDEVIAAMEAEGLAQMAVDAVADAAYCAAMEAAGQAPDGR